MLYGNKGASPRLDIIGPKGQTIPKAKINTEYFITQEQFKRLFYEERKTLREIIELIRYPGDPSSFSRSVRELGWKKALGSDNSKYQYNNDFFDEYSLESAWFLGWILTDGYLHEKYVDVRIHSNDSDVIFKLKDAIGYDGPLYDYSNRGNFGIRIHGKEIVSQLTTLGVPLNNKSLTARFPEELPEVYFWDFARGVTEGDGWITRGSEGSITVGVCGVATDLLIPFMEKLSEHGVNTRLRIKRNGVMNIETRTNADALRWCFFMYSNTDASVRMDRKFNVFIDYVTKFYERQRRSSEAIELVELIRKNIPECNVDESPCLRLISKG